MCDYKSTTRPPLSVYIRVKLQTLLIGYRREGAGGCGKGVRGSGRKKELRKAEGKKFMENRKKQRKVPIFSVTAQATQIAQLSTGVHVAKI